MSRKPILAIGIAAAFALSSAAQAQMSPPSTARGATAPTQASPSEAGKATKASKADQAFLKEGIQGDLTEVKMGELAQQKGQSDSVKIFGETLQKDHGDHLKKLQGMAQQMNAQAPSEPSAKQQADYDKFSKMSGAKFDREFAKHMVTDHKKDIAKYQAEAKKTGPLAELAKETVPTLQKHLKMAQDLEKPAATTGSSSKMR